MLSICIPIYNREMCDTVRQLAEQAAQAGMPCEIVCIDDCSDTCYREANRPLHGMCRYVELEQNIGRARIRNLFLQYARYDYLLFLDCDSLPPEGFLSRYAEVLRQKPRVVCGGRVYGPAWCAVGECMWLRATTGSTICGMYTAHVARAIRLRSVSSTPTSRL